MMRLTLICDGSHAGGWVALGRRYETILEQLGVLGGTYDVHARSDGTGIAAAINDTCKEIKKGADDGVVLLLPHEQCAAYARTLLRMRMHVFAAAWPLSYDTAATEDLLQLARQRDVVLDCGRVHACSNSTAGSEKKTGREPAAGRPKYNAICNDAGNTLARIIADARGSVTALGIFRQDEILHDSDDVNDMCCASSLRGPPSDCDYDCSFGITYDTGDLNGGPMMGFVHPADVHTANIIFGSAPSMVFSRAGPAGDGGPGGYYSRVMLAYGQGRTAVISTDVAKGCGRALDMDIMSCGRIAAADLVAGTTRYRHACNDDCKNPPEKKTQETRTGPASPPLLLLALQNFLDAAAKKEHAISNVQSALAAAKTAKASLLSGRRGVPIYLDL